MQTTKTKLDTEYLIPGPVGQIQLVVEKPIGEERGAWGIVCHPHSLYGGSMENKVVTTLAKTFQHLGLTTVRFNFRGVDQSAGKFDKGSGELDDLLTVINWVLTERPDHTIWLAGFSFGAYVAMKAATQIPVACLVSVAPPVEHFLMNRFPPLLCPWILVQGEKDEVVSAEGVFAWAKKRKPKPLILKFPEASHFFHGQLTALRTRLEEALKSLG